MLKAALQSGDSVCVGAQYNIGRAYFQVMADHKYIPVYLDLKFDICHSIICVMVGN